MEKVGATVALSGLCHYTWSGGSFHPEMDFKYRTFVPLGVDILSATSNLTKSSSYIELLFRNCHEIHTAYNSLLYTW